MPSSWWFWGLRWVERRVSSGCICDAIVAGADTDLVLNVPINRVAVASIVRQHLPRHGAREHCLFPGDGASRVYRYESTDKFASVSMKLGLIVALVALSSAAFAQEPPRPVLAGTSWTLREIGRAPATAGRNGVPPHIAFNAAGTVSVFFGCNLGSGAYTADSQDSLTIPHLYVTRMRCRDQVMQSERAFGRALAHVTHFAITGAQLELFDEQHQLVATLDQYRGDKPK
jgi:heat shock protein HslJ